MAKWCSVKVFVSRNSPHQQFSMKMVAATDFFQDHMLQRCEKPSPLLTHLSFLHKKTEQRILQSSYILALFFIKTDLINKGQKGGHPIYCYYPFWGHLELEFLMIFGWRPKNCWWNSVWKLKWGNLNTYFIVNKMLYHEVNMPQNLDVLYEFGLW